MHAMKDNAHALPSSNQGGYANHEADERKKTPAAACAAQGDENGGSEASDNTGHAQTTCEDDTRAVPVANGPSNEIGMGLATKGPLNSRDDVTESGWMGCVLKSVEQTTTFLGGYVELTTTAIGNVDGDDPVDLFTIRLHGNCR